MGAFGLLVVQPFVSRQQNCSSGHHETSVSADFPFPLPQPYLSRILFAEKKMNKSARVSSLSLLLHTDALNQDLLQKKKIILRMVKNK